MNTNENIAIAVDLGTCNSCVGVFINGKVEIIASDTGARTVPSYVAFTDNDRFIGDAAKNQAATNPKNTIYDAKRLIGRIYSEKSTQDDIKHFPFKVIDKNNKPIIQATYKGELKDFQPEEISSMVLNLHNFKVSVNKTILLVKIVDVNFMFSNVGVKSSAGSNTK